MRFFVCNIFHLIYKEYLDTIEPPREIGKNATHHDMARPPSGSHWDSETIFIV
jgi:hypothetical protein